MPKAKEPRPTFQKYVACRYTESTEGEPGVECGLLIGRAGPFQRNRLQVWPVAVMMQTEDKLILGRLRLHPGSIVAQADTLLGIAVKAERFLKLQRVQSTDPNTTQGGE